MLLASNALASAPLATVGEHSFEGTLAESLLVLSAEALAVLAALTTGAAGARQRLVLHRPPLKVAAQQAIPLSNSRTVTL
ncbi:MAG: hypothetical protein JKY34_10345 [Kordiimonadaceae bacterium]|nr:hypothetical protein [Kordiimonadaceae bacterium]